MIESEQKPVEESDTSAQNVGQEHPKEELQSEGDENKSIEAIVETKTDAPIEKPVEGVSENVEQLNLSTEGEAKSEALQGEEKPKESDDKAVEMAGSETTIESDIDSDFDVIEEIDPSYAIESSLWKKVADFDECDLKPAKPEAPEGAAMEEKKKKKEDEAEAEEDSGFSEIVIRSEKEKDQEFQEYIRELCRPSIVSYLPDRVAAKGSNVRLTCTVQGNNIQTRWMRDDVLLERGKKIQTRSDGEIHSLEITGITEREAGVYTAYFKNRAGEVETSSRIKVYDGTLHKPEHIDIALVKGELKLFSNLKAIEATSNFIFKSLRIVC